MKLHASIIITYRCNARCSMCEVWKYPSRIEEEIGLDTIAKLPKMFFVNITGGEPFIRRDLPEIVDILRKKAKRIVISSNGYFTDKIVDLYRQYPDIGIRISIEGISDTNDKIRNIPDGFNRGIATLNELMSLGVKDIGLAMTVQDVNCADLVPVRDLSTKYGNEFATAALHNSHYFHKWDNKILDKERVCNEFRKLIDILLKSKRPKDWFRAYFNYGLINYIMGKTRLLPCEMGQDGFFLDPYGDILACNGMDKKEPMGNLKTQSWEEIWDSPRAKEVRRMVKNCEKNCWMIGSAAPAIWHHPLKPILWVVSSKFGVRGRDTVIHPISQTLLI